MEVSSSSSTDCPAAVDRISELPDDVLHSILMLMSLSDAGVTTTLSKRWRYLLHEIPDLRIDGGCFNENGPVGDFIFSPETWFSAIETILSRRRAPIRRCVIQSIIQNSHNFDSMISQICDLGVRDLTLDCDGIGGGMYDVPQSVLHCDSLNHLRLTHCNLEVPPFITGLSRVKTLKLQSVSLSDNHLRRLVSRYCRKLEELHLLHCPLLSRIVIQSTSLKVLKVMTCSSRTMINICVERAPCLSDVQFSIQDDGDHRHNNSNIINNEVGGQGVTWFLDLLRGMSQIQSLALSFGNKTMRELMEDNKVMKLPKRLPHQLQNLKKVHLKLPFSNGYLISILSCLVNSSPNVEELIIDELWPGGRKSSEEDYWDRSRLFGCIANWPRHTALFVSFKRLELWIGFIRLVVTRAITLKKLSVSCWCFPYEETQEKNEFENARRELMSLQQVFPHVSLEITPFGFKFW